MDGFEGWRDITGEVWQAALADAEAVERRVTFRVHLSGSGTNPYY